MVQIFYWPGEICKFEINRSIHEVLTHFWPMIAFYTPRKNPGYQRFSGFPWWGEGLKMGTLARDELRFKVLRIKNWNDLLLKHLVKPLSTNLKFLKPDPGNMVPVTWKIVNVIKSNTKQRVQKICSFFANWSTWISKRNS